MGESVGRAEVVLGTAINRVSRMINLTAGFIGSGTENIILQCRNQVGLIPYGEIRVAMVLEPSG